MRALVLTLLGAILPLLVAALLLGAYLNYASVRSSFVAVTDDRLDSAARRVAADAQTALSLGLPLAGQSTLERRVTREALADNALAVLDVVGPDRRVLYSSTPGRVGLDVDALNTDVADREALVISPFGTIDGYVVALPAAVRLEATFSALWHPIFTALTIILVVGASAVALTILFSARGLSQRMRPQSRRFTEADWPPPGTDGSVADPADEAPAEAIAAVTRMNRMLDVIERQMPSRDGDGQSAERS